MLPKGVPPGAGGELSGAQSELAGRARRLPSRYRHSEAWFGAILMAPAGVVLLAVIAYPLLELILTSLQTRDGEFVGLHNFTVLIGLDEFHVALWHSILLAALVVAVELVLALGLALAMETAFAGRAVIRTCFILPWPLPAFVAAYAFVLLLDYNYGFQNHVAASLGLPRVAWLGQGGTAFAALVGVMVWKTLPWTFLTLTAALGLVSSELREAARIDGATRFAEFWHIVLPTLRPIIGLIVTLRLIWTFNDFELPYLLTGGGPGNATLTLPTLTYNLAFPSDAMNIASSIGLLLLLLLGFAAYGYVRAEFRGSIRLGSR